MLGIPDLGYLFDNLFMVESLLFSSPAHPKPQGPHLSAPAKSRQTCFGVCSSLSQKPAKGKRNAAGGEDLGGKRA